MPFDLTSGLGGDGGDVTAEVVCEADSEPVSCHPESHSGVDRVVPLSGGEELARGDEPPSRIEAETSRFAEGTTDGQVVVELRDADGETLRRFVRTVDG